MDDPYLSSLWIIVMLATIIIGLYVWVLIRVLWRYHRHRVKRWWYYKPRWWR